MNRETLKSSGTLRYSQNLVMLLSLFFVGLPAARAADHKPHHSEAQNWAGSFDLTSSNLR